MSDTDSFIDEVNEEVRRDRMFNLFRRYGWIAVAAVLLLVGGAAWNEWRASQEQAQAEAMGDAIVAALNLETASARDITNYLLVVCKTTKIHFKISFNTI